MNTEILIADYASGLSSVEISKLRGISKQTILRRLANAGVVRRSISAAQRIYNVNESYFDAIDTEQKAYWLGFLLADGTIAKTGRNSKAMQLRCALQFNDFNHLEKLRSALDSTHPIKKKIINNKRTAKKHLAALLNITSIKLCSKLIEIDWYKFKQDDDTSILEHIPEYLKRHLVRGLIDGDGHIYVTNNKWAMGFTDLHHSIVNWVMRFIMQTVQTNDITIHHPSKAFTFQYSGSKQTAKILHMLYDNSSVYLTRKKQLAEACFASRIQISA